MKLIKIILTLFTIMLLTTTCREKYVPQLNEIPTGYLVVEGFINSGAGATTINLSRTSKISAQDTIIPETKATVRVEGKLNTTGFALTETSAGIYTTPQLTLNTADQYRLHIKTSNGKEYVSDYSDTRSTPDIDSIVWRREFGDVKIYGNSHSIKDSVGYYEFRTDETWEFHSNYKSYIKIFLDARGMANHLGYKDSVTFGYDTSIFRCWKTGNPSNIVAYTTEKSTQNIASMVPVLTIAQGDRKLSVLYSVNVHMYYISRANEQFLDALRKNTESIGSVFDAQPTDNNGNLHALADPNERVIGFVEITSEKQKRIFISNAEVPGWNYTTDCGPEFMIPDMPHELQAELAIVNSKLLVLPTSFSGNFAAFECVDCTRLGSNKKPSFWP